MIVEELLFVEDIAKLFNVSEDTIRRKKWRQKNGIPLHRVGKRLCGLKEEIEEWFRGLNG